MKIWINNEFINQGDTPLRYFQLYWKEYIDDLLDEGNSIVRLEGPRLLLNDILSEIIYNRLRNEDNIKYYKMKLGEWLKKDVTFKRLFGKDIEFSFKYFSKQYILVLEKQFTKIIRDFPNKRYFEELFNECIDFIETNPVLTYDNRIRINHYIELLVAEFQSEGFALGDLASLATETNGLVLDVDEEIVDAPKEYFNLKHSDYSNKEAYYNAVKTRYKNRSIKEQLQAIIEKFYATPIEGHMIIRLKGLKGDVDVMIDDVHIYSPRRKKYISESVILDIEKINDEEDYVNAAIPIDYIGLNSAIEFAKYRLESILEILSLTYDTKVKIDYSHSNFVIAVNGKVHAFHHSVTSDEEKYRKIAKSHEYYYSIDTNEIIKDREIIVKHYNATHYPISMTSKTLSNAVHWCYKAQNAPTNEEKLLYSWFVLESLMKVSQDVYKSMPLKKDDGTMKVIQYMAAAILSILHFRYFWRDVYVKTLCVVNQYDNCFNFSDKLIQQAGLNLKPGDKYNTIAFLSCIPELESAVSHGLFKNELHETNTFYSSKESFNKYVQTVKNDILEIYRLRNLIAHNAIIPYNSILLYSRKAYSISRSLTRFFISKRKNEKDTMDEMILNASLEFLRFEESFEDKLKSITG